MRHASPYLTNSTLNHSPFPTEGFRLVPHVSRHGPLRVPTARRPGTHPHNVRLRLGIHTGGDFCPFANQPSSTPDATDASVGQKSKVQMH